MVLIISILRYEAEYECEYIPSVETFDITSEYMTDDSAPFEIAQRCMMWLTEKGYLGEIEIICPNVTEESLCERSPYFKSKVGNPHLQVVDHREGVWVQKTESDFTVWFSQDKEIDLEVKSNTVTFLASNDELVGIRAERFSIVKY